MRWNNLLGSRWNIKSLFSTHNTHRSRPSEMHVLLRHKLHFELTSVYRLFLVAGTWTWYHTVRSNKCLRIWRNTRWDKWAEPRGCTTKFPILYAYKAHAPIIGNPIKSVHSLSEMVFVIIEWMNFGKEKHLSTVENRPSGGGRSPIYRIRFISILSLEFVKH